jgi:uncharacterized protein
MSQIKQDDPYSSPRVVSGKCQILSLDGGGIKGLFSAAMLAAFEEDTGSKITDHFDLLAGTSTGGIIALALAHGLRPKEIVDFYEKWGAEIFKRVWAWTGIKSLFRAKYSQEPLRKALMEVFGDTTLGALKKRVVIGNAPRK